MGVDWNSIPATGAEILADMEAGITRIWNDPVPPPCGSSEKHPHIVHPDVAAGKSAGRCGNCGQFVDRRG